MIHNYPFFGFPNYLNHTQGSYYTKNVSNEVYRNSRYRNSKNMSFKNKNDVKNVMSTSSKCSNNSNVEHPFIDLFGISLSFDDVLLVCVILFLFYEKTDDYYLLLALVLLLLG